MRRGNGYRWAPWWTEGGAYYAMDRRFCRAMMRAIKKARENLAERRVAKLTARLGLR
jgi:hypothetical protein